MNRKYIELTPFEIFKLIQMMRKGELTVWAYDTLVDASYYYQFEIPLYRLAFICYCENFQIGTPLIRIRIKKTPRP